jgi:hypothetical protein
MRPGQTGRRDLGEITPGGSIEHHQVAVEELARHTQRRTAALEALSGRGERAVRDRHVEAANAVVDDLMVDHDPLRIRARLSVEREADDRVARAETGLGRADEDRPVDRWNAVGRRASRHHEADIGVDVVTQDVAGVRKRQALVPRRGFGGGRAGGPSMHGERSDRDKSERDDELDSGLHPAPPDDVAAPLFRWSPEAAIRYGWGVTTGSLSCSTRGSNMERYGLERLLGQRLRVTDGAFSVELSVTDSRRSATSHMSESGWPGGPCGPAPRRRAARARRWLRAWRAPAGRGCPAPAARSPRRNPRRTT